MKTIQVKEWCVVLSKRDAGYKEFIDKTSGKPASEEPISKFIDSLIYVMKRRLGELGKRTRQGATITPSPFWYVDIVIEVRRGPGGRVEEVIPRHDDLIRVRTASWAARVRGAGKEKEKWRDVEFEGYMEPTYLFAVLTGEDIGPYLLIHRRLAVIPVTVCSNGMVDVEHNFAKYIATSLIGSRAPRGITEWVRRAQSVWTKRKSEKAPDLCTEWLDWHGKLKAQTPTSIRVVYNRSGKRVYAALVDIERKTVTGLPLSEALIVRMIGGRYSVERVPLSGVIVSNTLHWIRCDTVDEAYWLMALLNSEPLNERVNQRRGKRRDFYNLPVKVLDEVGLSFNPDDEDHRRLVELAQIVEREAYTIGWQLLHRFNKGMLNTGLMREGLITDDRNTRRPKAPRREKLMKELKDQCEKELSEIDCLSEKLLSKT